MKIAILGFGDQGVSALEYWKDGNDVTVCDANPTLELPEGVASQLGKDYLKSLEQFELLIRTPALHPQDIVAASSEIPDILGKVTTVTNEFFRVCPTKNIIGVTGTKGKGTSSTLITKMLEAAGKKVHLGGNIGIPPLEMLKNNIKPEDYVVLELANFQLIDLKYSPHIATCLMVVPEHMDWHEDMDEYVAAKQQLFKHQTEGDIAIYYAGSGNSQKVVSISPGHKIPYFKPPGASVIHEEVVIDGQSICSVNDLKLLGKHNWQNVCAAVTAVWQVSQDDAAIRSVLTTFTGLEHRLELVRELDGIKYYDDSFGTAPETAIVAMEAFKEPKVIILGGSDKGAPYAELADVVVKNNVRKAVLIGDTGPAIEKALNIAGFVETTPGGQTMVETVNAAKAAAQPGDVVLLSTACASFGLFKNYKDRGEQFKAAVSALS